MLAIITGYKPLQNDKYLIHLEAEEKGTFGLRTASTFTNASILQTYGAEKPTQYIGLAVHIKYSSGTRSWYLKSNRKELN